MNSGAAVHHTYNGFGQLVSIATADQLIAYAYNAQGIRTARYIDGGDLTEYLLDGGNVVGEVEDSTVTTYLRGANLISCGANYYLYNAHGDVVGLATPAGTVTKTYDYDAFGNEKKPTPTTPTPSATAGSTTTQRPACTISGPGITTPPWAASPRRTPTGTPPT